jgi:hypothetical protein
MPSSAPNPARRVLAGAVCVALVGLAGLLSPRPAAAEDLTALLARPVSPGSIALLVPHATQPAAQKRLAEAVKHEDPAVRAVAARVAFVTMSKGLAPGLISTLAKEEHAPTAAEQVRTLMALFGEPGDAIILNAVKRIGGPTVIAMAESLARTRPLDIPKHMPMFAAMPARDLREVGATLSTACVQHPAHAEEILLAVMATKNEDLLKEVLSAMRDTARPVPSSVLLRALKSDEEYQRVLAVWHLFFSNDEGDPIPEDVMAAAAPQPIAAGTPAGALTWDAFVRELFSRQRGTPATKADWAGMLALDAYKERVKKLNFRAHAWLTDAELNAIGAVRGDREADGMRRSARQRDWETLKVPEARTWNMRTMPVFAKGLLTDLMQIHGCRPSRAELFAAGDVKYRPDGRAQTISVSQTHMSGSCVAFVNAAMMLTIASLDHPVAPDLVDRVIVLLDPAFLACADDPFAPSHPRGADLAFVMPKVTREPRVQYPDTLMRVAGMPDVVVTLRVRVTHTGCISSAETMRSVLPAFDLEAIQAMFGAKMTPATLGGEPVDTYVTYSVRFSLRR